MRKKYNSKKFKRKKIIRKITKHDIYKYAKMLKRNMTVSERKLWNKLAVNCLGVEFEPQVVVHGYIPDFYCKQLKLCIEVDGKIHNVKRVKDNDRKRESILLSYGIVIIRFTNDQVDNNIDYVMNVIKRYVCRML